MRLLCNIIFYMQVTTCFHLIYVITAWLLFGRLIYLFDLNLCLFFCSSAREVQDMKTAKYNNNFMLNSVPLPLVFSISKIHKQRCWLCSSTLSLGFHSNKVILFVIHLSRYVFPELRVIRNAACIFEMPFGLWYFENPSPTNCSSTSPLYPVTHPTSASNETTRIGYVENYKELKKRSLQL